MLLAHPGDCLASKYVLAFPQCLTSRETKIDRFLEIQFLSDVRVLVCVFINEKKENLLFDYIDEIKRERNS